MFGCRRLKGLGAADFSKIDSGRESVAGLAIAAGPLHHLHSASAFSGGGVNASSSSLFGIPIIEYGHLKIKMVSIRARSGSAVQCFLSGLPPRENSHEGTRSPLGFHLEVFL
jgi:hypothetical protein